LLAKGLDIAGLGRAAVKAKDNYFKLSPQDLTHTPNQWMNQLWVPEKAWSYSLGVKEESKPDSDRERKELAKIDRVEEANTQSKGQSSQKESGTRKEEGNNQVREEGVGCCPEESSKRGGKGVVVAIQVKLARKLAFLASVQLGGLPPRARSFAPWPSFPRSPGGGSGGAEPLAPRSQGAIESPQGTGELEAHKKASPPPCQAIAPATTIDSSSRPNALSPTSFCQEVDDARLSTSSEW
jgi:hypothetical protein